MAGEVNNGDVFAVKLTDWAAEPGVPDLRRDYEAAKPSHDLQVQRIQHWNDLMKVQGKAKPPQVKGRSSMQPKLIRRQAEWRYSALTEPFLSTPRLFKVSPVTFEDTKAAAQNEKVLNYQFRTQRNRVKFVDDIVRGTVDEGTGIIRTGWFRHAVKVKQKVPVYDYLPLETAEDATAFKEGLDLYKADNRAFTQQASPEIQAAIQFFLHDPEHQGTATKAVATEETALVEVDQIIENHPTADVLNPLNVIIDPSCGGDIDKAMFAIVMFETSKADLLKEGKRYKNLDKVVWESSTPELDSNYATSTPSDFSMRGVRRKVVAYEYWGFYDIHDNGELVPIVATWIGNTMIRMEENPYPDKKLPFVIIPYLPVKRELHGEPDAELLEDQQKILGAMMRAMIDLIGKTANGQQGIAKGMLDALNKRRYDQGLDYEFNPNLPPSQGMMDHKSPEVPQSAMLMVNLMNQEAEGLTGVKSFSGGMSGNAYGDVAAGIRSALDAASKREMAILRRIARGIAEVGEKFAAMNGVFLSEKETIRITNEEFITFSREDLKGEFDFEVDIATAEVDNQRSQELAFMIQTIGPNTSTEIIMMLLAEIADLKRMPELAQKIRNFKPTPDPVAQKKQELEIAELEAKIAKLNAEAALANARAKDAEAGADKKTLDFVEQETGTTHERELQKQKAQGQANQDLEITKGLLDKTKEGESAPDIEAAVGWNEFSRGGPAPKSDTNRLDFGPAPVDVAPVDPGVGDAMPAMTPDQGIPGSEFAPQVDPSLQSEAPQVDPGLMA